MAIPACYGGSLVHVDLSTGRVYRGATSDYADYVGGRGLGTKLYWDEVPPGAGPFDDANEMIFVTGPLTGFAGFGGSRWQVYGKTPIVDRQGFSYSNLGGSWGAGLKSTGIDALIVRGRSDRLVYLLVDEDSATLRDASRFAGMGAIQTREALKAELGSATNVLAIGPAPEHGVLISSILADQDASGTGGFGSVMGSKGLKAIAVRKGSHKPVAAQPEILQGLIKRLRYLVGSDRKITIVPKDDHMRSGYCWGCPGPCPRHWYRSDEGKEGKFMCQDAVFYRRRSQRYYNTDSNEVAFYATNLCNEYGIDTMALDTMMLWLARCFSAGILSEAYTGLPLSTIGSKEFITALLRKLAFREGFGEILAHGTARAAEMIGKGAREQIGDLLHKSEANGIYGPRIYIANGLVFAIEPRQAKQLLHEISFLVDEWVEWVQQKEGAFVSTDVVRAVAKRFWGSEEAADFTSYEGKAMAAMKIQDRTYAKECLVLCDYMWPVMVSRQTPDHVGDPTLESRVVSAVLGREVDEEELNLLGRRTFERQRAIVIREGHRGRIDDSLPEFCFTIPLTEHLINPEMLVPGPGGETSCRKGAVVDRQAFEVMKDEYYRLRGWDIATGLPFSPYLAKLTVW